MICKTLGVALGLLSVGRGAIGQATRHPAVALGERVRLKVTGGGNEPWQRGSVVLLSNDTLWLDAAGEASVVPLGSIRRLEVSQGQTSNFARGLGIGLLGGAALGATIGLADGDDSCEPGAWFCWRWSAGEKAKLGAVVFGGLGAIVGGLVGAATRSEHWVGVRPADLRLGLSTEGGVTLGASYRF